MLSAFAFLKSERHPRTGAAERALNLSGVSPAALLHAVIISDDLTTSKIARVRVVKPPPRCCVCAVCVSAAAAVLCRAACILVPSLPILPGAGHFRHSLSSIPAEANDGTLGLPSASQQPPANLPTMPRISKIKSAPGSAPKSAPCRACPRLPRLAAF